MGSQISGKEDGNFCPLIISSSNLNGIKYQLTKYETHNKSPILIAGLYADGETVVTEEVPSRNHTELMLQHLGAHIKVDGRNTKIKKAEELIASDIFVPGDISIASYFIAAGLIVPDSDITIKNVGINPTRTGLLDILKTMGANIELINQQTISNEQVADIRVKSSNLNGITIESDLIPRMLDEIPIIAVIAAVAKGSTVIKDLKGFKVKDKGIVKSLSLELSKMGVYAKETDDGLLIEGGKKLKGTVIESHNSSSIAMAMSIAGLVAEGETMIRKAQVIDVVYPDFFTVLNEL
jgi:3-phosphoshikimate 1-carboxyvinyltransferase